MYVHRVPYYAKCQAVFIFSSLVQSLQLFSANARLFLPMDRQRLCGSWGFAISLLKE